MLRLMLRAWRGCSSVHAVHSDVLRVVHFLVGVAKAREITRSRNNVQIVEDPVIPVLLFHLRYAALRVLDIAKNNRFGWAGLRACSRKRVSRNPRVRRSACA